MLTITLTQPGVYMRNQLGRLFALFVMIATLAPFSLSSLGFAEGVKAPEVSFDELKKIVKDKSAVLVDANGTSTYKEGHIPGALDFEKHEGDLLKVLPKDKKSLIIAYCGGPMCTAWENAAKKLTTLGYTNIKHFKGGLKVWKDSSQPVTKG